MYDSKTVRSDTEILDPLYTKQKEDVANMRASLLACNKRDPLAVSAAVRNITIMRVYHQMCKIIKYTEMMDRIEDKLYESIDVTLDTMDTTRPSAWMALLNIQERLQKSMIDSHKLLEPYLNIEQFPVMDMPIASQTDDSFASMLIDQESREKLRTSAQAVLAALNEGDSDE